MQLADHEPVVLSQHLHPCESWCMSNIVDGMRPDNGVVTLVLSEALGLYQV